MVDIPTALAAGSAATLVPLYVGIFAPQILQKLGRFLHLFELNMNSERVQVFLAAFAAGILVWFLVDVLGESALLDVNQGFTGGYAHVALAGMFAVGLLLLFWLEKVAAQPIGLSEVAVANERRASTLLQLGNGVAIAVAAGIGFHALSEGLVIGAVIPSSTSILYAIGGVTSGIAYVLHKLLEGVVISVFALLARSTSSKRQGLLGLIAGIPTILGFMIGVSTTVDSTYFFALGGAGGIYAELRLVPIFSGRDVKYGIVVAFLLGIYAMYVAGLFHGIQG